MGLAGGLVRRVFSKTRPSTCLRDGNEKNLWGLEKCRWTSVRLYLCGDEFNSVIAEDGLASIRSSEPTVMQPIAQPSGGEQSVTVDKEDHEEESAKGEEDTPTQLLSQEKATILIQSAYRGFLARKQYKEIRQTNNVDGLQMEIPPGTSEGASIEVQIGGSVEGLRVLEEGVSIHRVLQSRSHVHKLKLQEEWDDSTVSSNELKLRIQNRLEAMTRRERALAYAFSQQLRICPTKKRSAQYDSTEYNVGWSWLERWMATRVPENSLVEDCLSKHLELTGTERRTLILKKRLDVAAEEKESCGSNDVSVNFDTSPAEHHDPRNGYRHTKNRLNATRNVSRRKTVPDYHCSAHPNKVSKRDFQRGGGKEKKCKQVNSKSTGEIKCKYACQVPSGN